jgi:hypothetical protein
MELRHEVHAHTDDNEFRQVGVLIIDGVQVGGPAFFTRSLNDEWLDIVAPMIQRQRARFTRERHARERRLGGAPE